MKQQEVQPIESGYRRLSQEELKRVKKKTAPLIACGIICIMFGVGISVLLYSVFGKENAEELMDRSFIRLIIMLVFMLFLGISICYKDIRLLAMSKYMMITMVNVNNIKIKPGDGFRYRGEVCLMENGRMKQVEAGILKDAIDTVRVDEQAKLYFYPGKYYILDKM
ncbi:MAG: hypothetical protein ACI4D8_01875 [Wujia sp.]